MFLRIRPPARRVWAVLAAVLLLSRLAVAQQPGSAGERIVDVIAALRDQGLAIIYSSELVGDDLRVAAEPSATAPVERLREMLQAHGLGLEPGPQNSWLIVRAEDSTPQSESPPQSSSSAPLAIRPPSLEEVVVSASQYSISRNVPSASSLIDRVQLDNTPTLGEDALRVAQSLPGLTSSGMTAQVNVRGGISNEALLVIDGVELFNPFHLKDFQSVFSSINPSIVDSMTVYTGAYPSQFGDRMSAVIEMTPIDPEGPASFELAASLFTTSLLGSGTFDDGRGAWITNFRRGNLDLLVGAADSDIGSPEYGDLFNKLSYDITERWTLGLGMLLLEDELTLNDPGIGSASADYDDSYLWARADFAGEKLNGSVLLSSTELTGDRKGEIDDPVASTGTLIDDRAFESTAVRTDWSYLFDERNLLSWGIELRESSAEYRYASQVTASLPITVPAPLITPDPNFSTALSVDGRQSAVYLSYRARPLDSITAELGLRWDDQDYLDDRQFSPRLNVLFVLNDRLRMRAGWGKYFQTQRLDELQINSGITNFFPAQESEHYVIGFDYLLDDGTSLRLEVYRKEIEQLHPRSENLFARVSLLPELLPDRVIIAPFGGESTGIELSADGEHGRWRWWASLARARSYDLFAGGRYPRSWEERWSLKGGAIRTGDVWNLALTTTWHSGWPIGALSLVGGQLTATDYNGHRFGEFGSVDLKLSRDVRLDRGEFEWYVSVTNLFARDNPCCIDYDVAFDASGQPASLSIDNDYWLSIVPNIGFLWRFSRGER